MQLSPHTALSFISLSTISQIYPVLMNVLSGADDSNDVEPPDCWISNCYGCRQYDVALLGHRAGKTGCSVGTCTAAWRVFWL